MHVLAILFAIAAVVCMIVAMAWMVTGRAGERAGWTIRAAAVACFLAAVGLSVASH
jgi:hypothetical protein